ncbi:MAG TPA: hypothetical protein VFU43_27745 [Streptosporangiaceae bacterium]|nr:hypothetical protein [Streptosporangiaceae bacterium]
MGTRPREANRIVVVGCPGAGKTTFARLLGSAAALPVHHLDDEYWQPGWVRTDPAAWERRQDALTRADQWIIDGNYLPTLHRRVSHAQVVVMVDAATAVCLGRVMRRAWRIHRGRYDDLPGQVRAAARAGHRVRATRDFPALLRLVLRFRRRDWWQVVDQACAARGATLVVAVGPGPLGSRLPSVRRRLCRRRVTALVVPLPVAASMIRDWRNGS